MIRTGNIVAFGSAPAVNAYQAGAYNQGCAIAGRCDGSGTYSMGIAGVEQATGTYGIGGYFQSNGVTGNRYAVLAFANGGTPASSGGFPAGQWAGAFLGNVYVEDSLIVQGKLRIQDYTVQPPDYVFSSDYNLRSIDEVDSFVSTHHHLPDIPSAAELKSDGIDIVELNMNLLRKVEELTLYTIAQERRIKALENRLSKMDN